MGGRGGEGRGGRGGSFQACRQRQPVRLRHGAASCSVFVLYSSWSCLLFSVCFIFVPASCRLRYPLGLLFFLVDQTRYSVVSLVYPGFGFGSLRFLVSL